MTASRLPIATPWKLDGAFPIDWTSHTDVSRQCTGPRVTSYTGHYVRLRPRIIRGLRRRPAGYRDEAGGTVDPMRALARRSRRERAARTGRLRSRGGGLYTDWHLTENRQTSATLVCWKSKEKPCYDDPVYPKISSGSSMMRCAPAATLGRMTWSAMPSPGSRQAMPEEQKCPIRVPSAKPTQPKKPRSKEEFHRHLIEMGLMSQLPDTAADFEDPDDQPIDIQGEPLSETVIRERR